MVESESERPERFSDIEIDVRGLKIRVKEKNVKILTKGKDRIEATDTWEEVRMSRNF